MQVIKLAMWCFATPSFDIKAIDTDAPFYLLYQNLFLMKKKEGISVEDCRSSHLVTSVNGLLHCKAEHSIKRMATGGWLQVLIPE